MPIEDPEGEFGDFKRRLFYDVIEKYNLADSILQLTDDYEQIVINYYVFVSSHAFWYYVSRATPFTPNHIDLEFWEAFPLVKKAIEDNTEVRDEVLAYKYKYPIVKVMPYTSDVL